MVAIVILTHVTSVQVAINPCEYSVNHFLLSFEFYKDIKLLFIITERKCSIY